MRSIALVPLLLVLLTPAVAWSEIREEFLATVNSDRTTAGLEPIRMVPEWNAAAEAAIANIARYGDLPEIAPEERSMRTLIRQRGYPISGFRYPWLERLKSGKGAAWRLMGFETSGSLVMHPQTREIGVAYRAASLKLSDGREFTHFWQFIIPHSPKPPYLTPVRDLLKAINAARAEKGVPPVALNAELGKAASAHAKDLVHRRYRGHTSPEGDGPADRVLQTDYRLTRAGEILQYGGATPQEAVQWWARSPGHAKIMYDPEYADVGIGYVVGPLRLKENIFYHVWAAVLARALPVPRPSPPQDAVASPRQSEAAPTDERIGR